MAVVVFSRNIAFPMAALRETLGKHFPIHTWLCGEEDRGEARQMGEFRPHIIISGRSPTTIIFTELRTCPGSYSEPSPPHLWHLLVSDPTIEQREIADQVKIIICATLMVEDQGDARCQLMPGGNWLDSHDLLRLLKLVASGETLDVAVGLGIPASQFVQQAVPRMDAAVPSVDDFASLYGAQTFSAGEPSAETPGAASYRAGPNTATGRDAPAPQAGFGRRAVGGFGRKRV